MGLPTIQEVGRSRGLQIDHAGTSHQCRSDDFCHESFSHLDSPANEIVLAFYDHANAFSHGWSAPNALLSLCADYMKPHGVPEIHEVMVETAMCIASLDEAE